MPRWPPPWPPASRSRCSTRPRSWTARAAGGCSTRCGRGSGSWSTPPSLSRSYERYLRTDELLSLQKPPEERVHHDELLFQTVHQSSELWPKLGTTEVEEAAAYLERDELAPAIRLMRRELLTEWDERIWVWRFRHYTIVARALGEETIGTQGTPVQVLGKLIAQRQIPKLWDVRSRLVELFDAERTGSAA